MIWTHSDNYDLIPNLYIRSHFKDGVLQFYSLYAIDGYVLYSPANDSYIYNEDGEIIYNENGSPAIEPYYSQGGATEMPTYDWKINPKKWQAILLNNILNKQ